MAEPYDLGTAYAHAMEFNAAAFAAGRYEVAYHFLMAAMHSAEDAHDPVRLTEVARRCREQLRAIDSGSPSHRLSSPSAQSHGHRSIFEMGAATAEAAIQRLDIQGRLAEHRREIETSGQGPAPPNS